MKKKTLEEKIGQVGFWTLGGIFGYLVIAFFLKSNYPIYEYSFNREEAYDAIKDALTLAAAFLAPLAAFVLFSDWREQHKLIRNESNIEEIILGFNSIDRKIKKILNTSLSIRADTIVLENLVPLKPEILECSEDLNSIFLNLRFFSFKVEDKEFQDFCSRFLIEVAGILAQCRFCLEHYEVVMQSNNDEGHGIAFLEASKTLLLGSCKSYWNVSKEKLDKIYELSEKYTIKS